MPQLTPSQAQDAIEAGYQRFHDDREYRQNQYEYYSTRWWGKRDEAKLSRPINLISQMVHAYVPQLVPRTFKPVHKPKRAGLQGEARKLDILVDNGLAEQNAIEEIYEPAVIDAMFSPFATLYTGLRGGSRVLTVDLQDVDPGEPFTEFIDFDCVAVDPNAKTVRQALWFAHKYRVPRHWLLESGAFQGAEDLINNLPAFENVVSQTSQQTEALSVGNMDRQWAMFDTVELWNIVIYDHNRMYEGTIPPRDYGPAEWLRFEPWNGPDGGPYDHLSFYRVPGNLPAVPPVAFCRDIAESGDALMRKVIGQAERSKVVLGYRGGAEDDAASVANAADGSSQKMEDPSSTQVFKLDMIHGDVAKILEVVQVGYNNVSGGVQAMAGTEKLADTLGQEEILNQNANQRVIYMSGKVKAMIRSNLRKQSYYYQTDPVANYPVQMKVPGLGPVDMSYDASTRRGGPADYSYEVQILDSIGQDPNLQAKRVIEFLMALGNLLPMAQMGLIDIRALAIELAPKYGIDNIDEIMPDPMMMLQRMQAEMGADQWLAQANASAPGLAGPGVQDMRMQQGQGGQQMLPMYHPAAGMMAGPGGMPGMGQPGMMGGGGMQPPGAGGMIGAGMGGGPSNAMTTMRGLRQQGR